MIPYTSQPAPERGVQIVRYNPDASVASVENIDAGSPQGNQRLSELWMAERRAQLWRRGDLAADARALIEAIKAGGDARLAAIINAEHVLQHVWTEIGVTQARDNTQRAGGNKRGKQMEASFDDFAKAARGYLGLSTTKRGLFMHDRKHGGSEVERVNRGLDVLECRGELVEEIIAERARRSAKWRLSPRLRKRDELSARDRAWFDRLSRSDWTAGEPVDGQT